MNPENNGHTYKTETSFIISVFFCVCVEVLRASHPNGVMFERSQFT